MPMSGPESRAASRLGPKNKLMGLVFMGIGALMLLSAVVNAWSTHRFVKSARHADGVVKELSHGTDHPLIEFRLPSGEVHELRPSVGGRGLGLPRRGAAIRIRSTRVAPCTLRAQEQHRGHA